MPIISGSLSFDDRDATLSGDRTGTQGRLTMAHCGESPWTSGERSPVQRPDAALVLAWDGRLDNADDLLLRLGRCEVRSDAAVALAVFDRYGVGGLELLVGDWSLAVWDRTHRRLHLARDYMGARPLYYSMDEDSVAWSGDLADLVDRCGRRDDLSDAFAARFMSLRPPRDMTPYEEVRAVPPGTCLTFSGRGAVTGCRTWTLPAAQIRYADSRTYEDQLRGLWRDAVRARLRTRDAVWAELSGGLDSSSVVCMADCLVDRGDVPATSIRLVSHATLHSPEGDERRFIAEVERRVGVRSEIVGVEDNQRHADPERAWLSPYVLQGVGLATVRRVRAAGGRVVLSGRLGDAIMGCQPDNSEAVFDDLASCDLIATARNLRAWSRATRKPFVELAWRLFVPEAPSPDTGVALLTPRLRAMVSDTMPVDEVSRVRRSKRTLARLVLGYALDGRLDIPHHPPDITYTYPFAHRPLVEFVLAIPGQELSAPGITRSLMRRAFAELLPRRVLQRESKGYYPPAALRAARRQAAAILDVTQLEVVARGWIDPDRLRQSLRALIDGGGRTGVDIHRVLRLEGWLEARHHSSAIPQRKEVNSHAVLNA